MDRSNGAHHTWDDEDTIDGIVSGYLDRLNAGEILDGEEVLRECPEHGHEVLERLETFQSFGSDSAPDGPLGTLGDYTLRRQIGRGGMGVVYEAWQNSMDRQVALKVLPVGIAADTKACMRFMREAQTAGRLNHQNIVGVHSTGVEEGTPWYSMEYVEGATLAQIVAETKDAEPDAETVFEKKDSVVYFGKLADAFADVADGLQHAHSKGVVHRDIKPSNLILDAGGKLRILDFGLARLEGQESLTLSGGLMGTVLYMSPEQAMAKRIPLDHRTDIYSLGATMYEALTGQPPFRGRDQHDTLSQIIVRDPRPPRQVNPRVPRDLETIVLKCLRKDVGDRYGTAEALAQDLRRFVRGDAVEARPESGWGKLARRAKPYTGRILAASIGLVLVVAVAGGFYLDAGKKRRARVARIEEAVTAQLTEAEGLWRQGVADGKGPAKLRDALAAAEAANALATDDVGTALRERAATVLVTLRRELNNRDMLARLQRLPAPTEHFEKSEAKHHAGFAEAFREYGIDVEKLDPALAAKRIRESGIDLQLSLAVEIWAKLLVRPEEVGASDRLMEVVMLADPDPWRNRLREAVMTGDIDAAKKLSREVDVGQISDRRIAFLAAHLFNHGHRDAAESMLRRAERHVAHERSYWTNYWLGFILKETSRLEESERYLRTAILCQGGKESGRVRAHLGHVLTLRGRLDEAVTAYTRAIRLAPGEEASYERISSLLARLDAEGKREALARILRALSDVVSSGEAHPRATRKLLEAWILGPDMLAAVEVLAAARREVKRARHEDDEPSVQHVLVLLARAQFAAGERRDAVRTLEDAGRLLGEDKSSIEVLLEGYRATLWPDLVSYASIDAAIESGEVLVPEGADWRFFRGKREPSPGLEWTTLKFDDRQWERGPSGIGYADDDDATVLEDMKGSYTSLYVRHRFDLSDPSLYTRFWLSVRVDDGCVAYVNGREIGRVRAGATGEATCATAVASASASEPVSTVDLAIPLESLQKGDNVLALQGLNQKIDSSDFTLIAVLRAQLNPEPRRSRERFEAFRRIAERAADDGAARLAYLEGRLHARRGDHEKAAEKFYAVLDLDGSRPEPYVTLAESLRASGDPAAGEQVTRRLLKQVEHPTVHDWNRWLAFNFVHLERAPAAILDVLPDSLSTDYREDLRWLLDRLAAREPVRINCGGGRYRGVTGAVWSADRFHVLGLANRNKTYSDKIAGTDDDPLYASWRYFPPASGVPVGYRIPLPKGRYRLTLHLAIVYPPAKREYEGGKTRPPELGGRVVVEGRTVIEEYAPLGFGSAERQTFTRRVEDGALDIELVDRGSGRFVPTISAVEIERVE